MNKKSPYIQKILLIFFIIICSFQINIFANYEEYDENDDPQE